MFDYKEERLFYKSKKQTNQYIQVFDSRKSTLNSQMIWTIPVA